ncbi:ribonuclease H-like domain-containing protein [Tanacetum coccineum]
MTHPHLNRRFVPQAVLTKSGKINTAGASVNIAVRQVNTAGSKTTMNHARPISNAYKKRYSQVTKPFNKYSANKNSIFNKKVNTVRVKDTTARDRAVVSENKGKGANAVKALTCWVWKAKNSSTSNTFKKYAYIDARGRSKHVTGNKCYLTEYEDYNGGFISFGDGKGRISGKVLSSDFKLLDKSQVLLRVPRKDNIYSVDLKSVVPTKGLTCLFAKSTIDESNLWHRRLSHINFKNMNKLVRGNLVRGEYDLWLMRIEQYFLMTDYSIWKVILNGNKVLKRTIRETEQEYEPTTVEEKLDRRNEMKARGTLLIALPNKDELKFHSYKDAKLLMEAIEKRYGGNKEFKKVQRTLLKQQYKNFAGSSSETIDQTFDRLQKLISLLEIQGEVIAQDDMNLKLLRSLPSEWKTHALIWRNKEEIKTISLGDFTNNNCNSSTNKVDNIAYGVSVAHTQCNPTSGDNLSDAMICAFLASQPNSPQLAREDLEQIDPDDIEEMDLQWEMAMLTVRARRFIKRRGRKLDVNGQRVGFDRSKVECYNCHKNSYFARECRAPRNQENKGRENSRRTVTVEIPTENALVAQDRIGGYDWSYQAEEEHPINFTLMAYTSSGSSSNSDSEVDSCSK